MLRTHALAIPLLLVLTLTSCGSPPVTLEPEPTPEELAYDEALAVYTRLTDIGNQVAQDGGAGADSFSEASTGRFLEDTIASYKTWIEDGIRQVGRSKFRSLEIWDVNEDPDESVIAVVCDDHSGTGIVDAVGESTVALDRKTSYYSLLIFSRASSGDLLLESRITWDDRSC